MFVRKHSMNWNQVMRVGLVFLIAAALSVRFMGRIPGISSALADGLTGLFYGLSIGCLLLSLRMRGKHPSA